MYSLLTGIAVQDGSSEPGGRGALKKQIVIKRKSRTMFLVKSD